MSSPVFTNNKHFQNGGAVSGNYAVTNTGPVMTIDNTMRKTVISFIVLVGAAGIGWFIPALVLPGLIIGFALAMVNSFKKEPSPPLILAYAFAEGITIGGLSGILEQNYSGIASQAVIGTLSVVAVVLFLFKSGKIRESKRATQIFLYAMLGYLLFSVVNLILSWTGIVSDPWGLHTSVNIPGTSIPLGIALGIFAVLLGSYSLVMDFTFIQRGVQNQLPEKYGWTAAFGIMVTVVWLYVEILRMIAIARN